MQGTQGAARAAEAAREQGTLGTAEGRWGRKESRVHYGAGTAPEAPKEAGYIMVPAQGPRDHCELLVRQGTQDPRRGPGDAIRVSGGGTGENPRSMRGGRLRVQYDRRRFPPNEPAIPYDARSISLSFADSR